MTPADSVTRQLPWRFGSQALLVAPPRPAPPQAPANRGGNMRPISFNRRRCPPEVIRHAVWLCFRFTLSLQDVEERLPQRGVEVSYETIR